MANNGICGLLLVTSFVLLCNLQIDAVYGQQQPRLEILPIQSVQRKPVGKSLMLTCRPNVPDTSLVTDLQWRDNFNMTVAPKPYYPKLDKMGNRINVAKFGQLAPPMYTEVLPGDQSLALLITSLTEGMAGKYYCSASYANTEQLEIDVRVETYVAITWKDAPENQFPTVGNRYTVKCEVTANPAPTVDWLRNGDPIKSGGRYVVEPRGLLIQNVDESDDGIYTCRAAVIQTGELVERNIRVEVQIVPHIGTIPKELEAVEEQPFSVQCTATGKPVPEYTWIKDSTQQNVQGADRFLVNPLTGQLSILRVTKDDYGSYTCVAKNSAGHDQKRTMLNVLVRPRIYELLNITVAEDHEAAIVCKATGRPAPEITFRRWGSTEELAIGAQPADDRVVLEQRFDESLGESVGTLRIQKLMRSDDGLYECVARNRGEQAFRVGHITVEYKPSFEHMRNLPPVFSWDERRANLSCLAQGFPNATIEWRWNDRLIKDLGDANLLVEGSGPRSDLLVTPRGGQYYTAYKCIASNRLGRVEHMMELRQARVPSIIPQVRERVITATTITFDIISPATEPGLPIMAFTVMFKESIQPDWAYAYNRTWSPDSMYIVEGLRPQTMYEFQFAARNMVGLSQWGGKVSLHTPKRSAPEAPRILVSSLSKDDSDAGSSQESGEAGQAGQGAAAADRVYVSPYSDHIELSWSVPADNGEPINSYQVRYCPGHKRNGAWHELENMCVSRDVLNSENSNFVMAKLEGDTYYRIELRAHNAIGFSQPSSLLMRTALGSDQVTRVESPILSSAAIVGIAIAVVLVLLLIVDLLCCILSNAGILATLCRRTKRSPSDLDEEAKIGSGQLVKEPPPSPAPLPPPVKLGSTPLTTPEDEREPLSNNVEGSLLKNSRVEVDGRVVISKSGEIIGKNSSV